MAYSYFSTRQKTRNSKQLSGGEKTRINGQPLKIWFEKKTPHCCKHILRVEVRHTRCKTECKKIIDLSLYIYSFLLEK